MDESATQADDILAPLDSTELVDAWRRFRAGEAVPCPNDDSLLALSVDASAGAYRFVCTTCGTASSWFEAGPSGQIEIQAFDPSAPE